MERCTLDNTHGHPVRERPRVRWQVDCLSALVGA
jgi:hypothetical protein